MRYSIRLLTLSFLLLSTCLGIAQTNELAQQKNKTVQADTVSGYVTDPYEGTDDFSPGMAFFALIGIGFILLCIGVGIALTVFALLIIFGLISFGILSASVMVGLNKKSFETGFKTFLVSASAVGGLILCGFSFWLLNKILHWWTAETAIATGAILGFLTGLAFGFIAFYILKRLTTLAPHPRPFSSRGRGSLVVND
jgi:hypothetical protein